MHEWISVKDELPEIDKSVLFSDGRYIDIGYRNRNDELYCMGAHMTRSMPTHWMPLPKPPNKPSHAEQCKIKDDELIKKYHLNKDYVITVGSWGQIFDAFTLKEMVRLTKLNLE
jgi:hypothetical protein